MQQVCYVYYVVVGNIKGKSITGTLCCCKLSVMIAQTISGWTAHLGKKQLGGKIIIEQLGKIAKVNTNAAI